MTHEYHLDPDSGAESPGPVDDIEQSSSELARPDRETTAREIVAGLRSHGEGCTCEAWAAMECGCSEAQWPEYYVDRAADFIEAMLGDADPVSPDTVTITISRESAAWWSARDPRSAGVYERNIATACRAALEEER